MPRHPSRAVPCDKVPMQIHEESASEADEPGFDELISKTCERLSVERPGGMSGSPVWADLSLRPDGGPTAPDIP